MAVGSGSGVVYGVLVVLVLCARVLAVAAAAVIYEACVARLLQRHRSKLSRMVGGEQCGLRRRRSGILKARVEQRTHHRRRPAAPAE